MNKLAFAALAASAAALPALAAAQTVNPPVAWEDVPNASLVLPQGGAGVTWQAPAAAAPAASAAPMAAGAAAMGGPGRGPRMGGHRGGMHRPPVVRHHQPRVNIRHHPRHNITRHHGGGKKFGHHRNFNKYKNYHRIDRGHHINRRWFGSQFHVQNWQHYGFYAPRNDWRWVRYYDDALLIDRDGRVMDGRWDMDWDRYGERWNYDDSGVPAYYGDDEYRDDYEDYAEERRERLDYDHDYKWGDRVSYRGAPYGWTYVPGPVIVETTITTTGGAKVIVDQKPVEHHRVRVRHHREDVRDHGDDCQCEHHKKPKLYGERG